MTWHTSSFGEAQAEKHLTEEIARFPTVSNRKTIYNTLGNVGNSEETCSYNAATLSMFLCYHFPIHKRGSSIHCPLFSALLFFFECFKRHAVHAVFACIYDVFSTLHLLSRYIGSNIQGEGQILVKTKPEQ